MLPGCSHQPPPPPIICWLLLSCLQLLPHTLPAAPHGLIVTAWYEILALRSVGQSLQRQGRAGTGLLPMLVCSLVAAMWPRVIYWLHTSCWHLLPCMLCWLLEDPRACSRGRSALNVSCLQPLTVLQPGTFNMVFCNILKILISGTYPAGTSVTVLLDCTPLLAAIAPPTLCWVCKPWTPHPTCNLLAWGAPVPVAAAAGACLQLASHCPTAEFGCCD